MIINHLSDGLGGTGGSWDNVLGSPSAIPPILIGRSVDRLLRGRGRVHGGHEAFDNNKVVVHNFGHRSQAVGRAAGIGDDVLARVVFLVVNAHDVHGGVCGRRRYDDLLRPLSRHNAGIDGRLTQIKQIKPY